MLSKKSPQIFQDRKGKGRTKSELPKMIAKRCLVKLGTCLFFAIFGFICAVELQSEGVTTYNPRAHLLGLVSVWVFFIARLL